MRISAFDVDPFHVLPYFTSTSANASAAELPFFRGSVDSLPASLDAIIALADLQGLVRAEDTLIGLGKAVAGTIARLQRGGELPSPGKTGVVLCGDLHAGAGEDDVVPVWREFQAISRWVAGVAGNHDRIDRFASADSNAYFLDASTVTVDGIRIGGVSGIVSPISGLWHRHERDYRDALLSLLDQHCELLLLHDGPNVAGTELSGWPFIRRLLESYSPSLVIRGHDHWTNPIGELANGTQVLNVEGRVVVLQR
jgi:hypothetical protein